MRGDVLALSDGSNLIALAFSVTILMSKLGIYVDESGNFGDLSDSARYCMVALVFVKKTMWIVVPEKHIWSRFFDWVPTQSLWSFIRLH
jgi:hypothetical protein